MGSDCGVRLKIDEEIRNKSVLMHQGSLCELQIELYLGGKTKIGGRNIEVALWG